MRPVVEYIWSQHGFVRGQTDGQTDRFLGIPYAAPPIGELRWKAPTGPPPWTDTRDATKAGNECLQVRTGSDAISGSEDCLYLNIFRPATTASGALLPVLLYIHGGSNQDGAGSDYDPSAMTAQGVIVVTINYRLGVFGFLALPSLDAEIGEPSSGNFGLMDQQAAMRWVRDNIRSFGGNPFAVTAAGESAGGINLCAHLTSPAAAGLFRRVILQSAYCGAITHNAAIQTSTPVASTLGCIDPGSSAACLRQRSAAEVLQAGRRSAFNASPNFGGSLLPLPPQVALGAGQWNASTVLLGANHDEASLAVLAGLVAANIPLPLGMEDYQLVVANQFGPRAPAVLREYPLEQYMNPFRAFSSQVTDSSPVVCPLTALSQSFNRQAETFRYEFDDKSAPLLDGIPALGFPLGAYHGSELQYLFRTTGYPGPKTAAQQQLSNEMIRYWANFVKTGNPNDPALPLWPRYDNSHQILSLRPEGSTVIDHFETDHHCEFWKGF